MPFRFIALFLFIFMVLFADTQAAPTIQGRVNIPADLLPNVVAGSIETVFGVPLAKVGTDGQFAVPPTNPNDLDILFLKDAAYNNVVLMGFQDDQHVALDLESTGLVMLLIDNPANGALDRAGKLDLIQTYRRHPQFPALVQIIRQKTADRGNLLMNNNPELANTLQAILSSVPQVSPPSLQANFDDILPPMN